MSKKYDLLASFFFSYIQAIRVSEIEDMGLFLPNSSDFK